MRNAYPIHTTPSPYSYTSPVTPPPWVCNLKDGDNLSSSSLSPTNHMDSIPHTLTHDKPFCETLILTGHNERWSHFAKSLLTKYLSNFNQTDVPRWKAKSSFQKEKTKELLLGKKSWQECFQTLILENLFKEGYQIQEERLQIIHKK